MPDDNEDDDEGFRRERASYDREEWRRLRLLELEGRLEAGRQRRLRSSAEFGAYWISSVERVRFAKALRYAFIGASTAALIAGAGVSYYLFLQQVSDCQRSFVQCNPDILNPDTILRFAIAFTLAMLTFSAFVAMALVGYRSSLLRAAQNQLAIRQAEDLVAIAEVSTIGGEHGERQLELSALWDVTHERLNLYHTIATQQAETSFRRAQGAIIAGFSLLALAIIVSFFSNGTIGGIVTGLLGAASAGLAGYLGRTFLRAQETAAQHLRAYFLQPLEFSRYLFAERLLETLDPRERSDGILTLVRGLASQPITESRHIADSAEETSHGGKGPSSEDSREPG